jgi:hypothetical protein
VNQELEAAMENVNTVEFVSYQLELKKEMALLHTAILRNDFKSAWEHSVNMQVEAKLLTNAISTWIKEHKDDGRSGV